MIRVKMRSNKASRTINKGQFNKAPVFRGRQINNLKTWNELKALSVGLPNCKLIYNGDVQIANKKGSPHRPSKNIMIMPWHEDYVDPALLEGDNF